MKKLSKDEARCLWYVAKTGGFTGQISEAMGRGPFFTVFRLGALRDLGLIKRMVNIHDRDYGYMWSLTHQGLEEHERRLRHAQELRLSTLRSS